MIADRYSLDREIGRGGMGAVWLGTDEVLGRQVALKRIGMLPGASSTDLARAEREARLAARLNHPHVVAIFNFVVEADERWLVMEYVEGRTLAELVQEQGPLTPDEAGPLLRQAADALVAAHAAGIVHRDVKPSNILVDRRGQVKLTDFGIAHVTADPSLTQTGFVTGSPAYLAPEVASGERGDEAADVWSLGATVFHVLSGRPPYDIGDHLLGGLYRIVNEEPPRLPQAGWLAPLLEGAMTKDPARRWSMAEVRDFLADPSGSTLPAGWVAGRVAGGDGAPPPATAAATPIDTRSMRPVASTALRERPWLVGLVGVALAVTLGLVLFAVLPGDEPGDGSAADDPTAPSASVTDEGSPSQEPVATGPTAEGMETFIRDYVAAVSTDPSTAWKMLSPKFQRESGGLETYQEFWGGVGPGEVLEVSADPTNLVVSYRVRFENFGTGARPTVLDLLYDDGRYLIHGERTEGFVPVA